MCKYKIKMETKILKDLYEKLDNIDNFIILVENNYDPDKKLLYKLLSFLAYKSLIKKEEIIIAYDIVNKLLLSNTYDKNLRYLSLAMQIKNYDIVELLVKHNVKLFFDEIKNITTLDLFFNNNYNNILKEYYILQGNIRYKNN